MGLGIEVLPKFLITPIYLLLLFKKINSMLFFRLQPNIYIYIYIYFPKSPLNLSINQIHIEW